MVDLNCGLMPSELVLRILRLLDPGIEEGDVEAVEALRAFSESHDAVKRIHVELPDFDVA